MNDKLKELYEKVSGDDNLKESFIKGLEAISNDDEKKDYIINFAKEQGVTLTDEDFPKTDNTITAILRVLLIMYSPSTSSTCSRMMKSCI